MFATIRLSIALSIVFEALSVSAIDFGDEIAVAQSEEDIQFSYNTSGTMGIDSMGSVHLVYYVPDNTGNPPNNQVLYRTIENGIPSTPIRVDGGDKGGGRHPSLAIDSNDAVHVTWQDYRHTTASGNYIDNLEIYYDKKSVGGTFSDNDVRITETHADHKGDSGYLPNIAVGGDGRVHVVWYDFTANGNNADVYLRSSDEGGVFPTANGIEQFRLTTSEEDFTNYTSNWMPDVTTLADGSMYAVWGFLTGWQGSFRIDGGRISQAGVLGDVVTVSEESGQFIDPPRLVSDGMGNLGLVSTQREDAAYNVFFHYKPAGQPWRPPVRINDGLLDARQPSLAFDADGNAVVVWQEDLSGIYQTLIARIDPIDGTIGERIVLNKEDADAHTPAVAVDLIRDTIHVLWIEKGWDGMQSIVYRREKSTGLSSWRLH